MIIGTPEQQAAYVIAQAACLMAEVAGMQTENQERIRRGETIAYPEAAFQQAIVNSGVYHNNIMALFRGDWR